MTITKITGPNFIGFQESASGFERMTAQDRLSGHSLEPGFAIATPEEIDAACALAKSAFPDYSEKSGPERGRFLEAIAGQILAWGEPLLERIHQETALPMPRLVGERGRTCGQLRMFAELIREGSWVQARIDTADPERKPAKPDLRRMLVATGPVAVYGASNFPLAFSVAGGDTASALAAGCPVVFKSNPAHLGTSEIVARAILAAAKETGMPNGVFSMVHGGVDVAQHLVQSENIDAVGFTGSRRAGSALFDLAAARPRPIPVFAEMGSINPVFLLEGALDHDTAGIARRYCESLALGVGQFCTNPGLVLGVGKGFASFLKEVSSILGDSNCGTMLTESILDSYLATQRLRSTDGRLRPVSVPSKQGCAMPAMHEVSAEDFLADTSLWEESFGPSALAVSCKSFEDMLRVAVALRGQLTASIQAVATDRKQVQALLPVLSRMAGRVILNDFPTGVEVCHSMQHGGPYPATTDSRTTSVGTAAIDRFARPVTWQNLTPELLPTELKNENPLGIWRLVNGEYTNAPI
jgi:NADP-dependent aldehyde dehydrogenase